MSYYYKLDQNNVVQPCDFEDYCRFLENGSNQLFHDIADGYRISTIFLCIDHGHGYGVPVLFETMIFNGDGSDIYQQRYSSYVGAENGHNYAVKNLDKIIKEIVE